MDQSVSDESIKLVPFVSKGKWGYFSDRAGVSIHCMYDDAMPFKNGLAQVQINSKWGVVDQRGTLIIPCEFDRIIIHKQLIEARTKDANSWSLFDKSGKAFNPPKCDIIYSQPNGWLQILYKGKYCLVDDIGKLILPCEYDEVGVAKEGMIPIALNDYNRIHKYEAYVGGVEETFLGKWGFADYEGRILINLSFAEARQFCEGFAPVAIEKEMICFWGYTDFTGEVSIPFKYEDAQCFSEGLAGVRLGCKWGFIDKTQAELIPFRYDIVSHFSSGMAKVGIGESVATDYTSQFVGKWGMVDKSGDEVVPCKYEVIGEFVNDIALVAKGAWVPGGDYGRYIFEGKYGFITRKGDELVPLIYDFATKYCNGRAVVGIGEVVSHPYSGIDFKGKYSIIDDQGNQLIKFQYDKLEVDRLGFRFEIGLWESESEYYQSYSMVRSGLLNTDGEDMTSDLYMQARKFKEGRAAVLSKKNNRWGFIDEEFRLVVNCKYDSVGDFSNKEARVVMQGTSFYINETGTEFYIP